MAIETLFADTIVNLGVANGLVRIDLGILGPEETVNGERKTRVEVTQRLVMPLEGFVRSVAMQQRLLGAINERAQQQAVGQSAPAAPSA